MAAVAPGATQLSQQTDKGVGAVVVYHGHGHIFQALLTITIHLQMEFLLKIFCLSISNIHLSNTVLKEYSVLIFPKISREGDNMLK